MQLSWFAVSLAGVAVFSVVVVLLLARANSARKRRANPSTARGPSNLHFVCAGCGDQFTHTKRTVAAWEKGTRRFFCNSCHRSWRETRPEPPNPAGLSARTSAPSRSRSSQPASHTGVAPTRSGCLSVLVVLVVLPVTLYVVAKYA
jgi:hypothetical protein